MDQDLRQQRASLLRELQKGRLGIEEARRLLRELGRGRTPLSLGQQSLWWAYRLDPESSAFHVPLYFRLPALDGERLRKATSALMRGHVVLGCRFGEEDGESFQETGAWIEPPVFLYSTSRAAPLTQLQEWLRRPFRLECEPPLRVYQAGPDLVLMVFHHIAFDGSSIFPVLETFLHAYHGRPGEPVQSDYSEFVAWEKELLASAEGERHRDYWLAQLEGRLPELPSRLADVPPVPRKSEPGEVHQEVFQAELVGQLHRLARSLGVSRSALFLALFQATLFQKSGASELIIGMPTRNRPEARFARAVGFFASVMPLRASQLERKSFAELANDMHRAIFEGLKHAAYPLPALLRQLDFPRSPGRRPLIQATYAYQDLNLEGSPVELVPGLHQSGECELVLEVYDRPDHALLYLKYDPSLFSATTVASLAKSLRSISEAVISDPYRQLADLEPSAPATLHSLFSEQARRHPQATALVMGPQRWSYGQLESRSNALARLLLKQGAVQTGELVAIYLDRGLELVAAMLAVLKVGAAYLPLDTSNAPQRLRLVLADSRARLVLTSLALRSAEAIGGLACCTVEEAVDLSHEALPAVALPVDALAYCIYTSGSSGRPKGVLVEHRNVLALMRHAWLGHRIDEHDVWTMFHSPSFDFSVWEMYGALLWGGCLVVVAREEALDPSRFLRVLVESKVTVLSQTPSAFGALGAAVAAERREGRSPDLALRYVFVGGESRSLSLMLDFHEAYPEVRLVHVYGITETTILVTCKELERAHLVANENNIGKPFSGWSVSLRDEQSRPVGPGEVGEICVGGLGVSRGYLGLEDQTALRFVADPDCPGQKMYRSGDLARRNDEGELIYVGRADAQVQLRGFRVELGEIDAQVSAYPGIFDCATVVNGEEGRQVLVTYYVATTPLEEASLRQHVSQRLPDYMRPAALVWLEELPLNKNGKVDREELARRRPEFTLSAERPGSQWEAEILAIWRAELGNERIGVTDPFFQAGGDSLLAFKVASQVKQAVTPAMEVADLFTHPTVRQLAEYLRGKAAEDRAPVAAAEPVVAAVAPAPGPALTEDLKDSLALVGISCHLPGAADHRAFWQLLKAGQECVRPLSEEELDSLGVDPSARRQPGYVPVSNSLDNKLGFDPEFFHISPRQAALMDPQLRQLLMHSWKALEDAGCRPDQIRNTGVFVSAANCFYHNSGGSSHSSMMDGDSYLTWLMSQGGTFAAMISHQLGLRGPSFYLHANCASSLVALHTAMQHLRSGDIDQALVGAATIFAAPSIGYLHQPGLNFSSDGHCRPFDARADGLVGGEGVAVVVLKRATDALAAGDPVYALLRGMAVNNDGGTSAGFSAPSASGQAELVDKVLRQTGIPADSIRFLEAHGTGTRLGDPVEAAGLIQAYRRHTERRGYCGLGSVKSNLGHLDTVAGLVGCIKVALSLRHQEIPPTINFSHPNPSIDFASSPFYVQDRLESCPEVTPLRAALSAYGLGGTNGHAIFERWAPLPAAARSGGKLPVLLSARTPEKLREVAGNLLEFLSQHPQGLADIATTLAVGRVAMAERVAWMVESVEELCQELAGWLAGDGGSSALQRPLAIDGSDGQQLASSWLRENKLGLCARLWAGGTDVSWEELAPWGRRVSLPTYPFAMHPYGAPASSSANAAARAVEPMAAPVPAPGPVPAASAGQGEAFFDLERLLRRLLASELHLAPEKIEASVSLTHYGVDSLMGARFVAALGEQLELELFPAILYDYPTLASLASHLQERARALPRLEVTVAPSPHQPSSWTPLSDNARIAVISLAGRFPGAESVEELWSLLLAGGDGVSEVPRERWDHRSLFHPNRQKLGSAYCKWGGFLSSIDGLDSDFFEMAEREASWYSPAERLFLETSWTLLERAGYTRARLAQAGKVGVFVGCDSGERGHRTNSVSKNSVLAVTQADGYLAGRVCHFFDLRGPSLTLSTLGSSSLVAVHQACESLRSGACQMALAGGVNLLDPERYLGLCNLGLLGSHPGSRSLSGGDGYLPAEAVGAVLLKPLALAERDGDPILAVIASSAQAHMGRALALTAPSPAAQVRLMQESFARAGFGPESVSHVEVSAHGGPLHDPAELSALMQVYPPGTCSLGSVHANLGFSEAASGVVSLIKATLMLAARKKTPFLESWERLPGLRAGDTHFALPGRAADWRVPEGSLRRLAVNSFGQAGCNAHLLLEEYPSSQLRPQPAPRKRLFPLSARDVRALGKMVEQLARHLEAHPELRLDDLAYTLQWGRETRPVRALFHACEREELLQALRAWSPDGDGPSDEDWPAATPAEPGAVMVPLPGYPFERAEHRFQKDLDLPDWNACPPAELEERMLAYLTAVAGQEPLTCPLSARLTGAIEDGLRLKMTPGELAQSWTLPELARYLADRELERFPLSEGQRGLWLMQQSDPGSCLYNASLALRLDDPLATPERLARAWEAVLEWHPELTLVIDEGETPRQRYRGAFPSLEEIELESFEELALRRALRRHASRPFDLARGPLARFQLFSGAGGQRVLMLTMHHIIVDGTSLMMLVSSFLAAYRATRRDGTPGWTGRAASYRDFVAWEQAMLAGPGGAGHLAFWRGQLAPPPPPLELPTDYPRSGVGERGQRLARLEGEAAVLMRAEAERLQVPLSVLFLALYKALLHSYSQQTDLCVGMPTLGRAERRFQPVVGYFINMVAVRSKLSPEQPFAAFAVELRDIVLAGLAHAVYPFPRLVSELAPAREAFRHPLFSVSYAYQNFTRLGAYAGRSERAEIGLEEFGLELVPDILPVGDGDMGLEVFEDGENFQIRLDYDRGLFRDATAQAMLETYTLLLGALPEYADRPLVAWPWPASRLVGPEVGGSGLCLHSEIQGVARERGDQLAVVGPSESWTYQRLLQRSQEITEQLKAAGVGAGDRVGLQMARSPELVAAWLATFGCQAIAVPLDPDLPEARREELCQDARPRVVLEDGSPRTGVDGPAWLEEDAAYLIFTSGSTGRPKGVLGSRMALAQHCREMVRELDLRPSDRVLHFAPLGVDTGLEQMFPTLLAGATLVQREPEVWPPQMFASRVEELGLTVVDLPPAYLHEVLLATPVLPSCLRLVIAGGEALSQATVRLWREKAGARRLLNAYGPTEATITATLWEDDGEHEGPPPIGRPLAGTVVELLDPRGRPVPPGALGEIVLGGLRIAHGYWHRPEESAARFLLDGNGRRYRSGDWARLVGGERGWLEFHGRQDDQVQIGGFRVECGEVEAALADLPEVRSCAVLALQGRLAAFVVPATPKAEWTALRRALARRLPSALLPSTCRMLSELPVAASGKVDREALRLMGPGVADSAYRAPQGAIEKRLVAVWSEVLGLAEPVGVDDNFFSLGGDSILALQVVARCQPHGLPLRMADLMRWQTVSELARELEWSTPRSIVVEQDGDDVPLTPIQSWFFSQDLAEPHHHNLAMTLEMPSGLTRARLEQAVTSLLEQHASLRLRFVCRDGVCTSHYAPREENSVLEMLPEGTGESEWEAALQRCHAGFDLAQGPLLRVLYADGPQAWLALVAHHLAVDVVSLRVLAEDLMTALDGRPLPAATSPYQAWSRRLQTYAESAPEPDWLDGDLEEAASYPADDCLGPNTVGSMETTYRTLHQEDTLRLLRGLPAPLSVDDVLLAALLEAWREWTGRDRLLVDLDRHGREALFSELDLSRSVGWFTSVHPVLLAARGKGLSLVELVRQQRLRVPRQGIDYGVRRYLKGEYGHLPPAPISFNYLGQFGRLDAGGPTPLRNNGPLFSPLQQRPYPLEMVSMVMAGRLMVTTTWSRHLHRQTTIDGFCEAYIQHLRTILQSLRQAEDRSPTPLP